MRGRTSPRSADGPVSVYETECADLDRAAHGRVVLGVGIGGEYPQGLRGTQTPIEERGRRPSQSTMLWLRPMDPTPTCRSKAGRPGGAVATLVLAASAMRNAARCRADAS